MALKPTIYKAQVSLSDIDRNHYDSLQLTLARHPSETAERMMVRLLAYCLQAREGLQFCKGLSDSDEPDLWAHELDGTLALWVDVGEPAPERIKKASRIAQQVAVYSFNSKSNTWWQQHQAQFAALDIDVWRFDWSEIQVLTAMIERNMEMTVSIAAGSLWVTLGQGSCELGLEALQQRQP